MYIGAKAKTFLRDAHQPEVKPSAFYIYPYANKFVLLIFFSLIKTSYQKVSTKPLPNDEKCPIPVDARRSKTLLLKFPACEPLDSEPISLLKMKNLHHCLYLSLY